HGAQTELERVSASPAVKGLRLQVKDLKREGDEIEITYVFEWVEPRGNRYHYPWEGGRGWCGGPAQRGPAARTPGRQPTDKGREQTGPRSGVPAADVGAR